jgi:hypothetical protein
VIGLRARSLRYFPTNSSGRQLRAYRTDENCQADYVPAICTKRNDADTVQESENRNHQKERPGYVAVHPSAPGRIGYARGPQYAQGGRPNRGSPALTDIRVAGSKNRNDWKAKQGESSQRTRRMSRDVPAVVPHCIKLLRKPPPRIYNRRQIENQSV